MWSDGKATFQILTRSTGHLIWKKPSATTGKQPLRMTMVRHQMLERVTLKCCQISYAKSLLLFFSRGVLDWLWVLEKILQDSLHQLEPSSLFSHHLLAQVIIFDQKLRCPNLNASISAFVVFFYWYWELGRQRKVPRRIDTAWQRILSSGWR